MRSSPFLLAAALLVAGPAVAQSLPDRSADVRPEGASGPEVVPPGGGPSAAADTGTLRVPDVPYIAQSAALCGGAAAAMVLRYWGNSGTRAEDFRPLVSGEPTGIPTDDLMAELRRLGWKARRVAPEIGAVAEQLEEGRPVVTLQRVRPNRYHYVVLLAVTRDGILFHDPARGPYRIAGREEWMDAWAATGRWAAVVWPGDEGEVPSTERPSAGGRSVRDTATADRSAGCTDLVQRGVRRVRQGETRSGTAALRAAADLCPGNGQPWAELAGLAFREGDYGKAERLAERAVKLSGGGGHAWRLLGSSRYLNGEQQGALRAWNRIDAPTVEHVRIEGLTHTRHQVALRLLGLEPETLLTPGRLATARRRLMELPALRRARVDYRALKGDRVEVRVAAWERRLPTANPTGLATFAARSLAERTVRVAVASPVEQGGLVSAAWRWSGGRPLVRVAAAAPAPLGIGARWEVQGSWERQTYRTEAALPVAPGRGSEGGLIETRRSGSLSAAEWLSSSVRGLIAVGVDRFSGGRTGTASASYLGVGLGASWHAPGGRWTGRARLRSGVPLGSGRGSYTKVAAAVTGRFGVAGQGLTAAARVGIRRVSDGAPLSFWPGAGTGQRGDVLLRAHPLVKEGRVAGPVFGRGLVYAGVDGTRWLLEAGPLRAGVAGFVDAAVASNRAADWPGRSVLVDAGGGLRLRASDRGTLRLDVAVGLADGRTALSAGWLQPVIGP